MRFINHLEQEYKLFRMIGWLPVGIVFYAASVAVAHDNPQIQLLLWKLGHVCTFSWIGYWIARQALGRIALNGEINSTWEAIIQGLSLVARAIIIFGALIASNGL